MPTTLCQTSPSLLLPELRTCIVWVAVTKGDNAGVSIVILTHDRTNGIKLCSNRPVHIWLPWRCSVGVSRRPNTALKRWCPPYAFLLRCIFGKILGCSRPLFHRTLGRSSTSTSTCICTRNTTCPSGSPNSLAGLKLPSFRRKNR